MAQPAGRNISRQTSAPKILVESGSGAALRHFRYAGSARRTSHSGQHQSPHLLNRRKSHAYITFNEHPSRYAWATPFALNSHEADMNHSPSCPRCNSTRIATRDYARKAGGAVGAAAGAVGSAAAALGGAEAGAALGMIAGPVGSIFGGLAGGLMGALFGSAAGCAAGSAVGAALDDNVLDNYECQACGHVFGKQHTS
ncbi:hypothetical protein [Ralstonia pseudosolanacearum]|uniref:hypothetical protein n=1 Tax=Ralstonia pseudosolanacearum TaxID=1310165 RepID=UPI0039C5E8BC